MEKKITVYVVRPAVADEYGTLTPVEGGKSVIYPTKSRANDAVAILSEFDVVVGVFPEKRVVKLA